MAKNIELSGATELPSWNPESVADSLEAVRVYVEQEAKKASDWYFNRKRWKARWSWGLRFAAIVVAAGGGLCPILVSVAAPASASASGLWASLLVGVAAGLMALDRAFGFSTGWIRYVTTGTMIRGVLEEFRLEWVAKRARAGARPTPPQVLELIQLAKDARLKIEQYVLDETKAWAAEFQNNLSQLERDARRQFEALRVDAEQSAEAAREAERRAALELTVTNAGDTDTRGFTVTLTGPDGESIEETLVHQARWARVGLRPGQYSLKASGITNGTPVSDVSVHELAPGSVCKLELALPIPKGGLPPPPPPRSSGLPPAAPSGVTTAPKAPAGTHS